MSQSEGESSRRKKILQDHKQVGKRFTPPFLQVGPLSEVSWVDEIMPELIWIALLIDQYGYHRGGELGLQLSKAASDLHESENWEFFAWLSTFEKLTEKEWILVIRNMRDQDILSEIIHAFSPLLSLYPNSPLSPIAADGIDTSEHHLSLIKNVLLKLFDRRDVFATMVQSAAIYFAFAAGILKIMAGSVFEDFSEVEKYPNTEKSRIVASQVKASLNSYYGIHRERHSTEWPIAFWNRGLELEECRRISDYSEANQEHG